MLYLFRIYFQISLICYFPLNFSVLKYKTQNINLVLMSLRRSSRKASSLKFIVEQSNRKSNRYSELNQHELLDIKKMEKLLIKFVNKCNNHFKCFNALNNKNKSSYDSLDKYNQKLHQFHHKNQNNEQYTLSNKLKNKKTKMNNKESNFNKNTNDHANILSNIYKLKKSIRNSIFQQQQQYQWRQRLKQKQLQGEELSIQKKSKFIQNIDKIQKFCPGIVSCINRNNNNSLSSPYLEKLIPKQINNIQQFKYQLKEHSPSQKDKICDQQSKSKEVIFRKSAYHVVIACQTYLNKTELQQKKYQTHPWLQRNKETMKSLRFINKFN